MRILPSVGVHKLNYNVRHTNYNGELWHIPEQAFHPDLETLITAKDHLITIRYGQPPFEVVFGAPHQSGTGDWRICENRLDEHGNICDRPGDDNTASFALVAFTLLQAHDVPCKVVIMAHSTDHDPNKRLDSPYCQEIFREKTSLLFECHACAKGRLSDLELSAGSNYLTQTVEFGRIFASMLEYRYQLGIQQKAGTKKALIFQPGGATTNGTLQLPARKTASLIEAGQQGFPALHLEAKPYFREEKGAPNTVSQDGLILGRAIGKTILQFLE
jgi:hypothetical protein